MTHEPLYCYVTSQLGEKGAPLSLRDISPVGENPEPVPPTWGKSLACSRLGGALGLSMGESLSLLTASKTHNTWRSYVKTKPRLCRDLSENLTTTIAERPKLGQYVELRLGSRSSQSPSVVVLTPTRIRHSLGHIGIDPHRQRPRRNREPAYKIPSSL